MPIGKRVVIIGGGLVGVELAEFLAERGRRVTVLEEGEVFASEMAHPRRWRALHELREMGAELLNPARVDRISEHDVEFTLSGAGDKAESLRVEADSVIITLGLEPNPDLAASLETSGTPVIPVGDCTGVGYIEGAIREGFHAALTLDEIES